MQLISPKITLQNAEGLNLLVRYERGFGDMETIDLFMQIPRSSTSELSAAKLEVLILETLISRSQQVLDVINKSSS
jgi:hypothetical protein